MTSAKEQSLARAGEWELVLVEDPFSDPQRACTVRNVIEGPTGGRRTRPRLRWIEGEGKLFIEPTVIYTHAVRLARRVVNVRDRNSAERFMPENEAQHQLRVDAGTVYEVTIKDPEFGTFAVHELVPGARELIAALPSGGTLYYRWTLDQAIETFEFPLDGFSQLVRQAPERCP